MLRESGHHGRSFLTLIMRLLKLCGWNVPDRFKQPPVIEPVHPVERLLELDLVLHCGDSTKGEYLHTLNVVDIATSWCEPVALPSRSQEAVKEGLEKVRGRLPFPLLGIDSESERS